MTGRGGSSGSPAATRDDHPVIAPGGPRPRESVRGVGPEETVVRTGEGILRVVPTAALEEREGSTEMADDLVLTPGGLRPRSQVHLIESGAVIDGTDGRLRKLGPSSEMLADFGVLQRHIADMPLQPGNVAHPEPKATPAFGSGWITFASWTNTTGTPASSFSTTWVIPDPQATQSGQVIFLFPGIQNETMIYQPVLQWGVSAAGGGNYWAVASWYVGGQGGLALALQPRPGEPWRHTGGSDDPDWPVRGPASITTASSRESRTRACRSPMSISSPGSSRRSNAMASPRPRITPAPRSLR